MKKLIRYFKRKKILMNEQNWYRSVKNIKHPESNFVHPHLMISISPKELYEISEEDFDLLIKEDKWYERR